MDLIFFLIIGLIAGWLAGKVMKGNSLNLLGNLVVGVVGSYVGGYAFGLLGIHAGGPIGSIITAFVGAVLFLAVINLLKK
ncbi:GlsB/YeaQ/YmgE family stress response membrane protein [Sulfidibacter corallicola]|uniref:GlsB/YeaQ/YmgE family stress response membrane protein n=1 Tax=Sulfidibacter corallicola TaxID=2818388 RepID=A0A8A4TMS6_SULCO|nr:GlsB/YeaQ/YmgE family stress response membrane protein [Sulfidibacter corallicola]QTD51289.1 GlsB/YeaQ/YmgE family stress response membrane protein [Sulfidibacter corallicola]